MARRKYYKRRRRYTRQTVLISFILLLAILAGLCVYFFVVKKYTIQSLLDELRGNQRQEQPVTPGTIKTGELSIQFLELGVGETGDCTLIKINDTEVLIDAGAKQESADTLVPYIKQYCTDNVLEYVIATHAHEDHIGAFYSTQKRKGIFESFECKTIIDFPKTNKEYSERSVYGRYVDARDEEIAQTEGAVHYTALQCYNQTEGAKRSYQLSESVSLNILYHKYYEQKISSGENDYSVCVLLTQGDYNYLFTGDLEEKGEKSLVESNNLPHCKVYKGGHHGSSTSTTTDLLNAITPENICICACAGSPEYTTVNASTFPTQECIDRMAQYTKNIYVTSLAINIDWVEETWDFTSMNGNILVKSDGIDLSITGSNNSLVLKETEWFKQNRVWNGIA